MADHCCLLHSQRLLDIVFGLLYFVTQRLLDAKAKKRRNAPKQDVNTKPVVAVETVEPSRPAAPPDTEVDDVTSST